jgi:hypothetical protein
MRFRSLSAKKLIYKDEKTLSISQDIVDPSCCHPKGGEEVAPLRPVLLGMPVDRCGVLQG